MVEHHDKLWCSAISQLIKGPNRIGFIPDYVGTVDYTGKNQFNFRGQRIHHKKITTPW